MGYLGTKPANAVLTSEQIADGVIGTSDLANSAVTTDKIAASAVTPAKMSQKLTLETAKTATGTAVDFTGIPSWAKRITVMFTGLSVSGSNAALLQLGDAGGIETTGYLCVRSDSLSSTSGFIVLSGNSAELTSGVITLVNINGNQWIASGQTITDAATDYTYPMSGTKTLSDVLTQVRVTRTSGDTFDAGTINIMYEG